MINTIITLFIRGGRNMKKNKKQLILILVPLMLLISALSGCVGPWAINTLGWEHTDLEGASVRIRGQLTLAQNSKNWNLGFAWDTTSHSNWDEYPNRMEADTYGALGAFSLEVTDLDRTTKYYYRSWGEYKLQQNQVRQGVEKSFIPGGPTVTNDPDNIEIGITSADLKGVLWHMGGAEECDVYFIYGTDEQHLDMETAPITLTATGQFSISVSDLESCTMYYYRAVAENDADTAVAPWIRKFTPGLPLVVSNFPTDVTSTSALFRGQLNTLGVESTCDVWFEYDDKDQYPPFELSTTPQTVEAAGQFDATVEDLLPGTTYFVRAVADNGICVGEGEVEQFTTLGLDGKLPLNANNNIDAIESDTQKSLFRTRIGSFLAQIFDWIKNPNNTQLEALKEHYPIIARIITTQ